MKDPIYLWRLSGKTYRIFATAEEQPYRIKTIKRVHEKFLKDHDHTVKKARIMKPMNAKIYWKAKEEQ